LYLIQSDANDVIVSYGIHLDKLFEQFESKQLNIKTISHTEALEKKWNGIDEGILLVHSFKAWPEKQWEEFLSNVKIPLFVVPTEFSGKKEMQKAFGNKKVSKIVVCTEYYQKFFLKTLEFDTNKVKLIYLPTEDFRPPTLFRKPELKEEINQPVILCPALLTLDKNYDILLKSVRKLKYKYRNLIFALYLKSHPNLDKEAREKLLTELHMKAQVHGLGANIRILLDTQHPYKSYLKLADLVLIPIQNNENLYSGTLIDALVAHKAIVTPDTKLAYDLCKKEAGIYLYTTIKDIEPKTEEGKEKTKKQSVPMTEDEIVEGIVDNCSIILDSPKIKDIMEEQNSLLSENHLFSKISQQYLNLIRRFKNK
jgi:glycosyltransferase involved in cell wall biosynthesis